MALKVGYTLSSEEFGPDDLVRHAYTAEEAGFDFAVISDHYHPWVDAQGHSPFVWATLGAIASVTDRLVVGTGVTCPTIRMHPAIVAHAAATVANMFHGRFFLGVGTGEYLNEHVLGDHWPSPTVRLEMLEEAIEVMRLLWQGGTQTHLGDYYTVDQARIYTLPEHPVPVMIAAGGSAAARLAGRIGDGLISTAPKDDLVQEFLEQGDKDRPRFGQLTVCWNESEEEAGRIALKHWPNAALKGPLSTELKLPEHYEAAAEPLTEDLIAQSIICGPDPERHLEAIRQFAQAGFDHVYVHQVGHNQEEFIHFYEREVLARAREAMPKAA